MSFDKECQYCGAFVSIACNTMYVKDNLYCCRDCYEKEDEPVDDDINNPKHYTQGKVEVIDFIEDMPCCEAHIIKYVARYKFKGQPLKDLKKAEFYLKRLIKREEEK